MKQINSERTYTVAFIEGDFTYSNPFVKLNDILEDEDESEEWKYAIVENIDSVLDLIIGERLQMKFNRDNEDSDGFIKRIK